MLSSSTWKVAMTKDLILCFFCEVCLTFFIIAMPLLLRLVMDLLCPLVRAPLHVFPAGRLCSLHRALRQFPTCARRRLPPSARVA
jgi:hypothetical protein